MKEKKKKKSRRLSKNLKKVLEKNPSNFLPRPKKLKKRFLRVKKFPKKKKEAQKEFLKELIFTLWVAENVPPLR